MARQMLSRTFKFRDRKTHLLTIPLLRCAHTKIEANICNALLTLDYTQNVFHVTHANKNIKTIKTVF